MKPLDTLSCASMLLSLLLLPLFIPVVAFSYQPQCRKGQYVVLEISREFHELYEEQYSHLDRVRYDIINVRGNNVTVKSTRIYEDRNEKDRKSWYLLNQTTPHTPIIAGDLWQGANISVETDATINYTTTKYFWGIGKRMRLNYYDNGKKVPKTEYYWHKTTGLLMMFHFVLTRRGGVVERELTGKVIATNIGFPWLWIFLGIGVIPTTIGLAYLVKRKGHRLRQLFYRIKERIRNAWRMKQERRSEKRDTMRK